MEGLGVVAAREVDDLLLGDQVVTEREAFTYSKVIEPALLEGDNTCSPPPVAEGPLSGLSRLHGRSPVK